MTKEDLIPLGQNEEHDRQVRAKLRGSKSKKRELSQQMRRAREKVEKYEEQKEREERGEQGEQEMQGITYDVDEEYVEMLQLISNPDASAMQIQEMLQTAMKMDLSESNYLQLIKTAIQKHATLFGIKQINVNINTDEIIKWLKQNQERGNEVPEQITDWIFNNDFPRVLAKVKDWEERKATLEKLYEEVEEIKRRVEDEEYEEEMERREAEEEARKSEKQKREELKAEIARIEKEKEEHDRIYL